MQGNHVPTGFILAFIAVLGPITGGVAGADTLTTTEYRITASSAYETTPALGNDGTTDLVVFTVKPLSGGTPGAGDIWYQPLIGGAPAGVPVQVTSGPTSDQFNDVSGDYIVYTAHDSIVLRSGAIVLYQISTGATHTLARGDLMWEPRIHGSTVVWQEGGAGASMVMYYRLAWLGTGAEARILAGPVPPAFDLGIGDRFAVWSEARDGQYDVFAFDLAFEIEFRVTATPGINEREPATSGAWIVWREAPIGATTSSIQAWNADTLAAATVADGSALNANPSVHGDLVTWESDLGGNADVWVYRFSSGERFQFTTDPGDQYLADVFGNLVAYADARNGIQDVYVSKLEFVPTPTPGTVSLPFSGFHVTEAFEGTEGGETATLAGTVTTGDPVSGSLTYDPATGQLVSLTLNVNDVITYSGPPLGAHTSVQVFNDAPYDAFEATAAHSAPLANLTLPPGVTDNLSRLQAGISLYDTEGLLYSGTELPAVLRLADFDWGRVHLWTWFPDLDGDGISQTAWRIMADFCPANARPIASAGPDQSVHAGGVVTLDGSGSSDPEGNYPLGYSWKIASAPSGSSAALANPSAVNPSFTADTTGDYTVELTVTDTCGLRSAPDLVTVSTANTPPVADAGPDQAIIVLGTTVQLDGRQSWDPDGDGIAYLWTMTSKPAESWASISDPTVASPTFVADVQGTYEIRLVVEDAWAASAPDDVVVSFENVKPVADAGGNQAVRVGAAVYLDGSASSDANLDPLSYAWAFVSRPQGSAAALSGADTAFPSFTADLAGTYVTSLVVNDGRAASDPANVSVTATTVQHEITIVLQYAVHVVNDDIDPASLKNRNMAKALTNKLNAALRMIDEGLYQDALDKLGHDILGKTDGCATSASPDRDDWIQDCPNQGLLYPVILEAMELLGGL